MRNLHLRRVLAVVALALLVAVPVAAQDKEVVVAAGWAPAWVSNPGITFPVGFMLDVAVSVAPSIQIVGDLGYSHKSVKDAGLNFVTGTGGVRYVIPQPGGQAKPFVEALVGLGYTNDGPQTGVAVGVGGGVDVKAKDRIGIRLQMNYFLNRISGLTFHEVRFGAGISYANKMK